MHKLSIVGALFVSGLLLIISAAPAAGQWMPGETRFEHFPAAWRYAVYIHPSLLSDFNRVDGLVQSLNIEGRLPTESDRPPLLAAFSRIDVHAAELPHYRVRGGVVGCSANLPVSRLGGRAGWWGSLSFQYRKQTTSPDNWIVNHTENALAALLAKYDYKNYHQIEGHQLAFALRFKPQSQKQTFTFRATWHDDLHRPLATATQWSLLPWSRDFQPNYDAAPGREHRLSLALEAEFTDTPRLPHYQARILFIAEKAGEGFGGDFDYDGVFGVIGAKTSTVGNQWLSLRLVGGARSGTLFDQHRLRLGGIGTLRGTPHLAFSGNRFWLINAEYRLGGDLLGRLDFFPFSTKLFRTVRPLIDFGLLYDVGTAYEISAKSDVLTEWFAGKARDNWGIFLSIADDLLRVEWASTRLLGHEYSDMLRLRTGWRL